MTNEQLTDIRTIFKSLETVFSQAGTAENLVNSTSGFAELLSKAKYYMTALENEPVVECIGADCLRDTIRRVVESIEILKGCVNTGIKLEKGDSLQCRFENILANLEDINQHLNKQV